MITDQDIEKLKTVFATREEIDSKFERLFSVVVFKPEFERAHAELREDIANMRESIHGLYVANDGLAKTLAEIQMEHAAFRGQTERRLGNIENIIGIQYA